MWPARWRRIGLGIGTRAHRKRVASAGLASEPSELLPTLFLFTFASRRVKAKVFARPLAPPPTPRLSCRLHRLRLPLITVRT